MAGIGAGAGNGDAARPVTRLVTRFTMFQLASRTGSSLSALFTNASRTCTIFRPLLSFSLSPSSRRASYRDSGPFVDREDHRVGRRGELRDEVLRQAGGERARREGAAACAIPYASAASVSVVGLPARHLERLDLRRRRELGRRDAGDRRHVIAQQRRAKSASFFCVAPCAAR